MDEHGLVLAAKERKERKDQKTFLCSLRSLAADVFVSFYVFRGLILG
jgi:hypothetical protein